MSLGRFFGTEAPFWLNLQSRYDMETAREILQDKIDKEVHPLKIPRRLLRGASILSINDRDKQMANKLDPNKAGTPGRDEKGASSAVKAER